jgi:cbb3-type cytochrome oxidase subunit 1
MRTVFYFLLLSIAVSMIALGETTSKEFSYTPYVVIMLLKAWFIYGFLKRQKRKRRQRDQEELFNDYMRSQIARNRKFL